MTTNGTLMSEEIAVFLLDNEFNIIFSLDGNKKLHDENRVKVDVQDDKYNTYILNYIFQ